MSAQHEIDLQTAINLAGTSLLENEKTEIDRAVTEAAAQSLRALDRRYAHYYIVRTTNGTPVSHLLRMPSISFDHQSDFNKSVNETARNYYNGQLQNMAAACERAKRHIKNPLDRKLQNISDAAGASFDQSVEYGDWFGTARLTFQVLKDFSTLVVLSPFQVLIDELTDETHNFDSLQRSLPVAVRQFILTRCWYIAAIEKYCELHNISCPPYREVT